jgi:predicted nucleic acid-binding protein
VRVLIDTNIVLDFLLQREPFFQDAELLFQAIAAGQVIGYVTATTLTDIFYISRKHSWIIMSFAAITTIVKMIESLPDALQEQVAEHVREYISELEDEARWDSSLKQTQSSLIAAARQAKQEIAEGLSTPMDYEQL